MAYFHSPDTCFPITTTSHSLILRSSSLLLSFLVGCFSPDAADLPLDAPCPGGAEGCECLNLMCETGLTCRAGICVGSPEDSPDETDDPTGSSNESCPVGTEGCECSSGVCEPDLSCEADICVPNTSGDSEGGTEGVTNPCGNGILDDGEMCDSTPACSDDCALENYDCNPFNNAGCREGLKCSLLAPTTFTCLAFADDGGTLGANECFHDLAPHDEECELGLVCTRAETTNTCETGGCCEELCDLEDPDFECQTPGNTCQPAFSVPNFPSGLEWLGVCGRE